MLMSKRLLALRALPPFDWDLKTLCTTEISYCTFYQCAFSYGCVSILKCFWRRRGFMEASSFLVGTSAHGACVESSGWSSDRGPQQSSLSHQLRPIQPKYRNTHRQCGVPGGSNHLFMGPSPAPKGCQCQSFCKGKYAIYIFIILWCPIVRRVITFLLTLYPYLFNEVTIVSLQVAEASSQAIVICWNEVGLGNHHDLF